MSSLLFGLMVVAAAMLTVLLLLLISGAVKYIPNDRIGVVEKLWSSSGSVQSGLLALNGEAGLQPELLRGGFHFFAPFQYRVHIHPMVSVTQGTIGYVFARDGIDLPAGQTLADNSGIDDFRDVRAFLSNGGQKGPQRMILREGTHIINPALFVVMTEEATYSMSLDAKEKIYYEQMRGVLDERGGFTPVVIKENTGSHDSDQLAVVTVQDGPACCAMNCWRRMWATAITPSRSLRNSSPPVAAAAVRNACWWRALTSSTACSRRWSSSGRP